MQYAKEQVIKFNEEYKKGITEVEYTVDYTEKLPYTEDVTSKSTVKNIGYFFLQQIYHDLRIYEFFKPLQEKSKATYDFDTINRFLTVARILDPKSKYGTYDSLDTYFEEPKYEYKHSMLFLDKLEDNYDEYIEHLFVNSNNIVKRDIGVCYYDCSNFYFEIEDEDEDYVDPVTGELIRGLRQYGRSKDHKPNPLAGMGLFMDRQGLPISMNIHVGNDNEQTTAIPLEKKIVQMLKGKPFIYCADAGLGSFNIRTFNSMGGRAFVVTQSIKNLSDTLQQAVFNDYDYRKLSDDSTVSIEYMQGFDKYDENNLSLYDDKAYKVLFADKAIDLGLKEEKLLLNGNTKMVKAYGNLEQRVIITFSRKAMEYQRHVRNGQI